MNYMDEVTRNFLVQAMLKSSSLAGELFNVPPDIYMGCSDVSEFEHIYGQMATTPSCVYDPLFT